MYFPEEDQDGETDLTMSELEECHRRKKQNKLVESARKLREFFDRFQILGNIQNEDLSFYLNEYVHFVEDYNNLKKELYENDFDTDEKICNIPTIKLEICNIDDMIIKLKQRIELQNRHLPKKNNGASMEYYI
jgi:hypothetical protein